MIIHNLEGHSEQTVFELHTSIKNYKHIVL